MWARIWVFLLAAAPLNADDFQVLDVRPRLQVAQSTVRTQTGGYSISDARPLDGKDEYAPHEPIVFQCLVQPPDGAQINYIWRMSEQINAIADNSRVFIWAPAGDHRVEVTVFWIDFDNRKFDIKDHAARFRVTGTPPGPDPNPGPDPEPDPPPNPDVPEGEFGLTKLAFENANKVTGAARTLASELADNFQGVSSGLAAGAYLNIGLAKADLQARNSETVDEYRDEWLEAFFKPLGKRLVDLESDGSISSPANMVKALKAVADGLSLVK